MLLTHLGRTVVVGVSRQQCGRPPCGPRTCGQMLCDLSRYHVLNGRASLADIVYLCKNNRTPFSLDANVPLGSLEAGGDEKQVCWRNVNTCVTAGACEDSTAEHLLISRHVNIRFQKNLQSVHPEGKTTGFSRLLIN